MGERDIFVLVDSGTDSEEEDDDNGDEESGGSLHRIQSSDTPAIGLTVESPQGGRARAATIAPGSSPAGRGSVVPAAPVPETFEAEGRYFMIRPGKSGVIGAGSFGSVLLAVAVDSGEMVAVKQMHLHRGREARESARRATRETRLLQVLDHPNVVKLIGAALTDTTLRIVMEYVPGGELASLVKAYGALPIPMVRRFGADILRGLAYLHANNITHGDISPANVLLSTTGQAKVTDLGSARVQTSGALAAGRRQSAARGTPVYTAPERMGTLVGTPMGELISYTSDVWSAGCVVLELADGRSPFHHLGEISIIRMAQVLGTERQLPLVPESFPDVLRDFIFDALTINPRLRPAADVLLAHDFISAGGGSVGDIRDLSMSANMGGPDTPSGIQREQVRTVLEVAQDLSLDVTLGSAQVIQALMKRAQKLLSCERCSVFMVDKTKGELWTITQGTVGQQDGVRATALRDVRVPVGEGIPGTVAATNKLINIVDALRPSLSHPPFDSFPYGRHESPLFDKKEDETTGMVTKTVLSLPIDDGDGDVMGVLHLVNKLDGTPFQIEDEAFAKSFAAFCGVPLRNAKLYQQLAKEESRAKALLGIARDLEMEAAAGPARVIQRITDRARGLLECRGCSVFLVDAEKNELWTVATGVRDGKDGAETVLQELRIPVGKGIAGTVAARNEMMNIPDAYECPLFNQEVDKRTGVRTRAVLCLPVHDEGGGVVAVMQLLNKQGGDQAIFDADDVDFATSFALFCGIPLRNARLYQQRAEQQERAASLLDISQALSGDMTQGTGRILQAVMLHAKKLMRCEGATVWVVDDDKGDMWTVVAGSSQPTEDQEEADLVLKGIRIPIGVGIAGTVCKSGEVMNISDAYQCPLFNQEVDKRTGMRTKTVLCLPVLDNGSVVAVLQLINKRERGTILLEIARDLDADETAGLSTLLTNFTRSVSRFMHAEGATVWVLDEAKGDLFTMAAECCDDESNEILKKLRIPLGTGLAGQCAQQNAVINVKEAYENGSFNAEIDMLTGIRTKSVLCVPVHDTKGEVAAVLQIINRLSRRGSSQPQPVTREPSVMTPHGESTACAENTGGVRGFDEADIETAVAMAALIARNRAVVSLARSLAESSCRDLQDTFKDLATHTRVLLGCGGVSLWMKIGSQMVVIGADEAGGPSPSDAVKGLQLEISRGIQGAVIESGQVVSLSDAKSHPAFDDQIDSVTGIPTTSVLCVPISSGVCRRTSAATAGVVFARNKDQEGQTFPPEDVDSAGAVAALAALLSVCRQVRNDAEGQAVKQMTTLSFAIDVCAQAGVGRAAVARAAERHLPSAVSSDGCIMYLASTEPGTITNVGPTTPWLRGLADSVARTMQPSLLRRGISDAAPEDGSWTAPPTMFGAPTGLDCVYTCPVGESSNPSAGCGVMQLVCRVGSTLVPDEAVARQMGAFISHTLLSSAVLTAATVSPAANRQRPTAVDLAETALPSPTGPLPTWRRVAQKVAQPPPGAAGFRRGVIAFLHHLSGYLSSHAPSHSASPPSLHPDPTYPLFLCPHITCTMNRDECLGLLLWGALTLV